MKKTILITIIIMLSLSLVFANQLIESDYINSITDEQINSFIIPITDYRFSWDSDFNLQVLVTYNTIIPIDENYSQFKIVRQEFYPKMSISNFYTCYYVEKISISQCIDLLVYGTQLINYNGKSIEPMLYQVKQRIQREKQLIYEYKEKIRYQNIINLINNNLE
jgi:hypothetical protein